MTTAWLTEAADDDLLDLGELSPIAPETRPTTTLDASPLGEISPVDANRQRAPAARAGSKPFPFAPSPVVKGATRTTAAFPRSPTFAPSPLAPKRASQMEPTENSPGTLASSRDEKASAETTAPAPAPSPIFRPPPLGGSASLAVPAAEPARCQSLSAADPPRGGGLSRHSRRRSLGLDAFQSVAFSKGLLEEEDDFDFAPSFTPKAAKGPGAFAPSPVPEEDEAVEEEQEEQAPPFEGVVEEEEEGEVAEEDAAEAAAEPAAEPEAPPPASAAAEEEAPVAPEPTATETAETNDAFERKLRAAMEAAERGGGLAGLSGGMQNSPPGGSTARPAAALSPVPDPALSADPRRDETCDEVHSDDDTVELQADVDVSMMDAEPRARTPASRGDGDEPRAPAAVLAALASPAEDSRALAFAPRSTPTSRETEDATHDTARPSGGDAPSTKRAPATEAAETNDAFERKLRAAMEAAERGGGLAGLSGGMQNSPPGSRAAAFEPPPANAPPGREDRRTADATEDDARASGPVPDDPVPDEREEKRMAEEATAAESPPRRGTKAKAKAPTDPDPEPETKGNAPPQPASMDDEAFERKLLAAMEAAERGGGLAGLSGGMQNSPPGSRAAKPTETAAAPETSSPAPETVDGDAMDVCGMEHDAPPMPREPPSAVAQSPVAAAPAAAPAAARKRDAKPPRSGKKSKRAWTPGRAPEIEETKDGDDETTRSGEEEGPSPPAADFEAMLAKAMAAADGGDVDAVLGGASSKMMNSPAPPRRGKKTPARLAKTPEGTPTRVSTRSTSARVTRASAAKSGVARQNVRNTPPPSGNEKKRATPTPTKKKGKKSRARDAASPVPPKFSNVDPKEAKEEKETSVSLDVSPDVSPVPEAPAAPPPPPVAWLKKAAEAKTSRRPEWVSEALAPAPAAAAPVVAAPVAPVAAPAAIAALAAAQSRAEASTASDGFDFEAKLQAALAAEAGGGAAAFGGASKVANSPTGSGEKRKAFSAKEEARRQGVTVAQIMHARAHADSSPLAKVRF